MRTQHVIVGAAAVLLIAAIVAGWRYLGPHDARIAAVSSRPRIDGAAAEGPGQQDFVLTEVAVTELPPGFSPFVFVADLKPPEGPAARELLEPAASGRAMLPPCPPGTELTVSVVVGGERYGFEREETIGTASATLRDAGRAFVLVPIRMPEPRDRPLRVLVGDTDGWPLGGARVSDAAGAWTVTTSPAGYARVSSPSAAVHVEPPADRPDLAPLDGSPGEWDSLAEFVLPKRPEVEVRIPAATDASVPPDGAEVLVAPTDGRPFFRRATLLSGRRILSLPLGTYTVSWCAEGTWRRTTLEVSSSGSQLLSAPPGVRATRVEIPGTWQGFRPSPSAMLVLLERSRLSCVLPRSIVESGGFELTEGRGYTSRFAVADVDDDGTAVFQDVAPGDWEVLAMFQPYFVSGCIRVDGSTEVMRVACSPRLRAGQIVGRVEGRTGARFDVQLRGRGRSYDVSRSLKCPGEYEFGDLPGGLYSVRAVAGDAFQMRRADDWTGFSPWRNVVLEPGGRVTVDFHVE